MLHCYYNKHARRKKGSDGHFIRSSLKIREPPTVSFVKNIDILISLKSAKSIPLRSTHNSLRAIKSFMSMLLLQYGR